ncbi:MAG TPA: substrate-binding domain-containing protein, partial [Ktedonobacteraceae bacterium]
LQTDSTSTVIQNVAQNNYAIGYAATGPLAKVNNVSEVSIDGYAPVQANVANNNYKFWGFEHMYTKGKPTEMAQALIDYMTSTQGKQEAAKQGFLEPADISSAATQAHQKH